MTNTKHKYETRIEREAKQFSRWFKVQTLVLHPEAGFNPCGAMPIQEIDSLVDRVRSGRKA